ncbi:MAG: hypothetical protein ACM3WQ_04865 [Chloroflexota bacterium]
MKDTILDKVATFIVGLIFMLLSLLVMVPLPAGESWIWLPLPFSPYLEFILGIPLFTMSLLLIVDILKKPAQSSNLP